MNREKVVASCTESVRNCWYYYNDAPLTPEQVEQVQRALAETLPVQVNTSDWEEYTKTKK